MKVTAIYHFPNTFFPDFFRALSKEEGIELRVLYCYPTTETGILNKKTGEYMEWGANLLGGYDYVSMGHKFKSAPGDVLKLYNPDVRKLITKENTDVIVLGSSYWAPTTWMAISRARKLGIPLITRATVEARRKRKWYIQIVREALVKHYCKRMSSGIYECEDQKNYLLSHGMKESDVFLAPCAVDNDLFQEKKKNIDKYRERAKLGINADDIVFLFVAGMNVRKRPMDLLLAFERIRKDYDGISLVFVGDGEEKATVSEYIEENRVKDVIVVGFANREEIVKYYAIADIYVLPTENDASPKTLNEAMNFALPVIITKGVGTSKELLSEGNNGYIYDAGDIDHLERILRNFVINKESIPEMGAESLKIVSNNGLPAVCNGWKLAINNALRKK